MQLSAHFRSEEFRCRCGECGIVQIHPGVVILLEQVRAHYGHRPVTVTSGCRCLKHNRKVGGAPHSKHLCSSKTLGAAADFSVAGVGPEDVFSFLDATYPGCLGLGLYASWVHADVRPDKARWG